MENVVFGVFVRRVCVGRVSSVEGVLVVVVVFNVYFLFLLYEV